MRNDSRILFLCTGNYYRSRFAEELFNHRANALPTSIPWRAFSRGLAERGSPDNVGPISPFALEGLETRGIVALGASRFPRPATQADFDQARRVIALKETEHRPMALRRFPRVAARIEYWHVDDIGLADPADALALIDANVDALIATLSGSCAEAAG